MPKETIRYTKGELTVIWKPNICIHSGICARGLGSVFNPSGRPWINMDGATPEQIALQVAKCPSGALTIENQTEHGTK